MMKSILIKAGMLAVTAAMVAWIGWPNHKLDVIDASTDTLPEQTVSVQVVASTVSPTASEKPPTRELKRSPPIDTKQVAASSKLNINQATVEELRTLPGIGEVLAQRMIERRTAQGPYRTVDDLREVKGIGAKRLEKLRPLVVVETIKGRFRTTSPRTDG